MLTHLYGSYARILTIGSCLLLWIAACTLSQTSQPEIPSVYSPTPTAIPLTLTPTLTPSPTLAPPIPSSPTPTAEASPTPGLIDPNKVVVTEFFYWYDPYTGRHITGQDVLSLHLPGDNLPDWRSQDWFMTEFTDMAEAGIDIAACGYWIGEDWADGGLPNMVSALDHLTAQNMPAPGLAMFYETVPLWGLDLTSQAGKEYLYRYIQRFFSQIPARYWGLIDERPVIWFYDNGGNNISRYNQTTFDFIYDQFQTDFGVRPFIVLDVSWTYGPQIKVDGIYTWGVAFKGYQPRDTIAGVGPGYDDSLLPSRAGHTITIPRDDGLYYERNLYYALASGKDILWLETWNEHHEASNINHTAEYGRKYIEITRKYVDMFRIGLLPPKPQGGMSTVKTSVRVEIGVDGLASEGLSLLQVDGDGLWTIINAASQPAAITNTPGPGRYLYFQVEPDFAYFDEPVDLMIEVEFFDQDGAALILEYDSLNPDEPDRFEDRYRYKQLSSYSNNGTWRKAKALLEDVRFAHGQNGGADFRFSAGENRDLILREVVVSKVD